MKTSNYENKQISKDIPKKISLDVLAAALVHPDVAGVGRLHIDT